LLSKKQLAAELGKSTRWIEQQMALGMPVEPRVKQNEPARFDLGRVKEWRAAQAEQPLSLEARVAVLERTVASLIDRRAS
jgi:phage terminase Nu1 subunit (DNA packaging protein)